MGLTSSSGRWYWDGNRRGHNLTCGGHNLTCGGHNLTCGGHDLTCGGHDLIDLWWSRLDPVWLL